MARILIAPRIGSVTRGKALFLVKCSRIAQTGCCTMGEVWEALRHIQPTVDALSHHKAMCSLMMQTMDLMCISSAKVSRLFMETKPFGFVLDQRSAKIASGQERRQTIGANTLVWGSQMPLHPWKEALQNLINTGLLGTSSWTKVELLAIAQSSVMKRCSACCNGLGM